MEVVFIKKLNMSINASWLVLAVVLLRLLFKKAPKSLRVLMWGLVGIRLICPFSFETYLSLIPSAETVPYNIIESPEPKIHSGISIFNSAVNPIISETLAPEAGASVNPMQIVVFIASICWIIGFAAMILYGVISYLRIHRIVRNAIPYKENIYKCSKVNTPFIFGIITPRIFFPTDIGKQDEEFVIAHEKAHIERRDHWWKPLAFLILSAYWFNPVLWVAYILFCKDIELATDEKVIKLMGEEVKKAYSYALINCSTKSSVISACPIAFGEVGIKNRIKSVLNYKKPALWIIIVAVITCVALTVGFLTNPVTRKSTYTLEVTELIYCGGMFSFVQGPENAPVYIVDGNKLYEKYDDSPVILLGTLEEITLNDDNFTARFIDGSAFGYEFDSGEIKKIKKNNKRAWQLYRETENVCEVYVILEQNFGEFYLGFGYYNHSYYKNTDGSYFRWFYSMDYKPNRYDLSDVYEPSTQANSSGKTVRTEFFSLQIPENWAEKTNYDTFVSERVTFGLLFYEKTSYNATGNGTLFGIYIEPVGEIYYPRYEIIGTLTISGEVHNVIVYYPSDVQYTKETQKTYSDLQKQIPDILKTVKLNK